MKSLLFARIFSLLLTCQNSNLLPKLWVFYLERIKFITSEFWGFPVFCFSTTYFLPFIPWNLQRFVEHKMFCIKTKKSCKYCLMLIAFLPVFIAINFHTFIPKTFIFLFSEEMYYQYCQLNEWMSCSKRYSRSLLHVAV